MASRQVNEVTEAADPSVTNGKRERRRTPEGEEIDLATLENEYGARSRGGVWHERAKWFREHPGSVKVYKGISPTTATALKKQHGLSAATRNTSPDGKSADVLVGYFPEGYDVPAIFQNKRNK